MTVSDNKATLSEQHIYGASRLGMIKQNLLIYDDGATLPPFSDDDVIKTNTLGLRSYEITNYLGNVNALLRIVTTFL